MSDLIDKLKENLQPIIECIQNQKTINENERSSPCPKCGGDDRFCIWINTNTFFCRQCEWKGDVIEYHCFSENKTIPELAKSLGIDTGHSPSKSTSTKPNQSTSNQSISKSGTGEKPTQTNKPRQVKKKTYKKGAWNNAEDNHVAIQKYFSTRGIHFTETTFPVPPAIRFAQWKDKTTGDMTTSLLFAVTNLSDKKVEATQRLWLDDDFTKINRIMKGDVKKAKRGIWFYRDRQQESKLITGEGSETVLSAMFATGHNGVAGMDSGKMDAVELPETVTELFILTDQDNLKTNAKKGHAGQKASIALAEKFEESKPGRIAYIITPSDDTFTKEQPKKLDFNDLLLKDLTGASIRDRFEKAQRYTDIDWEPPESENNTTLSMMLSRFVLMRNGNKIVDLEKPPQHAVMKKEEFVTAFRTLGLIPNGYGKPKIATNAFFDDPRRMAVVGERFSPGAERIYESENVKWFNPFVMPSYTNTESEDHIELIISHLEYLFPLDDDFKRFVNWLAWTVIHPEVRIKFTPLLIATNHGTGRGWLNELIETLLGVWNSTSVEMPTLAGQGPDGQYHNYLHNSVFCSMPEVKVDKKDSFAVDDKIRAKLTEKHLPLNLKYGANGTFKIFANFLMNTNHRNGLVLQKQDRRIEVFEHFSDAKEESYYNELYAVLNNKDALNQFYNFLVRIVETNKETFNPYGRARMSEAKKRLIGGGKSLINTMFDRAMYDDPREVLTFNDICEQIAGQIMTDETCNLAKAEEKVLEHKQEILAIMRSNLVVCSNGKRVKYDGKLVRIYAKKNESKWIKATSDSLRKELGSVKNVPF